MVKKVCLTLTHDQRHALVVRCQPKISQRRACQLAGISRASLTYQPRLSVQDQQTMARLDEIYTRHPFYGSRRLRFSLARDYGLKISRDHVRRLMR